MDNKCEYMDREREALEELVQTEGWRFFERHLREKWTGPGFLARLGSAFDPDPQAAKVLYLTAGEVLHEMQWPEYRLRELVGDRP